MRWDKLVDDTRPKDLVDWKSAFPSVVQYQVLSRSEFTQNPTETDLIIPTPCIYCKRKVKIPVEVPLLQAESKCGGRRRKSVETKGIAWRTNPVEFEVETGSLSWIPMPASPLLDQVERCPPPPPDIAPF